MLWDVKYADRAYFVIFRAAGLGCDSREDLHLSDDAIAMSMSDTSRGISAEKQCQRLRRVAARGCADPGDMSRQRACNR